MGSLDDTEERYAYRHFADAKSHNAENLADDVVEGLFLNLVRLQVEEMSSKTPSHCYEVQNSSYERVDLG